MVLRPLGISVEEFRGAEDLMKGLDRRQPELIFLDICLERSDAVEALRGIAERNYRGAVILMSGRHGQILEDIVEIGRRHGLQMLPALAKPFEVSALRNIVLANFPKPAEGPPRVAIKEALQRRWLKVWYQPKIDLGRKVMIGCEALARIEHPEYGILSPGTFLPGADAESHRQLAEHVLLTVLRDCVKFKGAGAHIQPAVNVPVDILLTYPLAALVRENRPKDDAWQGLILEVTEEQIVGDIERAQEVATQLKIYDIELAIDDFGAGYSSLSRLKNFPFAEIKLDMSFVQGCASNPQNAGICKAVIDLAHSFNSFAVAEGVEQADDLRALYKMGCDRAQGFLFAPAMPVERFVAMLMKKRAHKPEPQKFAETA
jgi:EAL domain-containing protein (putative c-di-GMP-specific phosphodiesterase class I)